MGKLFKRGRVWQAWIRERSGRWSRKSTNCTDRRAAEVVAAELERGASDPAHRASRAATTQRVLDDYQASRHRLGRAEGTLHHVRVKAGALLALLPSRAEDITHQAVERYIDVRLSENVRRTTIKKELRVLKAALRVARKNGLFAGDPADVIPYLEDDHEPGTRVLTATELASVSAVLTPRRMALIAFAAATGCDSSAIWRAKAEDVAADLSSVHIHGTKRKLRNRVVPLALPSQRALVAWALEHADGGPDGTLFSPWSNMRRDIGIAAAKVGIARFTANDLRRTFGTMLRNAGVEPQLIAPAMGHKDGRQVERVYGRLSPEALGTLLEQRSVASGIELDTPIGLVKGTPRATVPLACCEPAVQGPMGLVGTDDRERKPPGKSRLRGAQGRNRTADTGIFRPPIESPQYDAILDTYAYLLGGGVSLVCCADAEPVHELETRRLTAIAHLVAQARAAIYRGRVPTFGAEVGAP